MKAAMKTLTRLLMVACLILPFAACKKAEAPVAETKAPMAAPTTDDRQAWANYLQDIVPRHMGGIVNQPYVYLLPGESAPDFQDQYDRLLEKTTQDVGRGIVEGNMLAYGGPASAKVADMIVASFKNVPPGTMKGVRVLFIGKAADDERVKAAVTPAGVDYVFVEAK
jgi:hypothetical protein